MSDKDYESAEEVELLLKRRDRVSSDEEDDDSDDEVPSEPSQKLPTTEAASDVAAGMHKLDLNEPTRELEGQTGDHGTPVDSDLAAAASERSAEQPTLENDVPHSAETEKRGDDVSKPETLEIETPLQPQTEQFHSPTAGEKSESADDPENLDLDKNRETDKDFTKETSFEAQIAQAERQIAQLPENEFAVKHDRGQSKDSTEDMDGVVLSALNGGEMRRHTPTPPRLEEEVSPELETETSYAQRELPDSPGFQRNSEHEIEETEPEVQPVEVSEELDIDEDRKNPAFIPKKGMFYEHDSRDADQEEREAIQTKKALAMAKQWSHDMYDEWEQAPKSTREIVNSYGYDIRREDKAPPRGDERRYNRPNRDRGDGYRRRSKSHDRPPDSQPNQPAGRHSPPAKTERDFPALVPRSGADPDGFWKDGQFVPAGGVNRGGGNRRSDDSNSGRRSDVDRSQRRGFDDPGYSHRQAPAPRPLEQQQSLFARQAEPPPRRGARGGRGRRGEDGYPRNVDRFDDRRPGPPDPGPEDGMGPKGRARRAEVYRDDSYLDRNPGRYDRGDPAYPTGGSRRGGFTKRYPNEYHGREREDFNNGYSEGYNEQQPLSKGGGYGSRGFRGGGGAVYAGPSSRGSGGNFDTHGRGRAPPRGRGFNSSEQPRFYDNSDGYEASEVVQREPLRTMEFRRRPEVDLTRGARPPHLNNRGSRGGPVLRPDARGEQQPFQQENHRGHRFTKQELPPRLMMKDQQQQKQRKDGGEDVNGPSKSQKPVRDADVQSIGVQVSSGPPTTYHATVPPAMLAAAAGFAPEPSSQEARLPRRYSAQRQQQVRIAAPQHHQHPPQPQQHINPQALPELMQQFLAYQNPSVSFADPSQQPPTSQFEQVYYQDGMPRMPAPTSVAGGGPFPPPHPPHLYQQAGPPPEEPFIHQHQYVYQVQDGGHPVPAGHHPHEMYGSGAGAPPNGQIYYDPEQQPPSRPLPARQKVALPIVSPHGSNNDVGRAGSDSSGRRNRSPSPLPEEPTQSVAAK